MGMLARLSQAAYLLGRVIRYQNCPPSDPQFNLDEKWQLERSIRALLHLTYEEGSTYFVAICPQIAMCFNALIILHGSDRLLPSTPGPPSTITSAQLEKLSETLTILRPLARESYLNVSMFFRRQPWSMEKSSPLLIQWVYRTAVTLFRIHRYLDLTNFPGGTAAGNFATLDDNHSKMEAIEGFETMRHKLSLLGTQWCAASTFFYDASCTWDWD
jgi:hypothetical protein